MTNKSGFSFQADEEKDIILSKTRCLSTQCDDVIKMISHFCQHNRFQVFKSVDSGLLTPHSLSHLCVCELTGQIYVSIFRQNLILIFDKNCSKLVTTVSLIRSNDYQRNAICIEANELFVLNNEEKKIEVFSTEDCKHRRDLPLDGYPKGLNIHNSILIVVVDRGYSHSFLHAMTKHGRTLWKTNDDTLVVNNGYGLVVNKRTDEVVVYTYFGGSAHRKYDMTNGSIKSNWIIDNKKNSFITYNSNGELLFCVGGVNFHINIQICSSDGKVKEYKPIDIPVIPDKNQYPPGFSAGRHGELVIFFNNRLYLIK